MIRILAISFLPDFLRYSSYGCHLTCALLCYRQFDGNLCTSLSSFCTTFHMKLPPEKSYPLSHTGKSKRLALRHRFLHVKPDTVILYRQLQHSIGGDQGNVYKGRRRVFTDIVKTFLHKTIGDNFQLLRQGSHAVELQSDATRMQPLEAVYQLPQRSSETQLLEHRGA